MKSSKSIVTGVAVLAALALPMMAGAADKLIVKGSDGTTTKMVVTDTGKIGVGTSNPSTAIHIKATNTAIVDLGSAQLVSQYASKTTNSGGGGFLVFHNNEPVLGTNPNGLPVSGDRLGYFLFGSYDGTTQRNGAGLTSRAEGVWSSTSTPAALLFETSPPNAVGTAGARPERMRVTGTGNVGIGTGTPTTKLEVKDGAVRINITNAWELANPRPACSTTYRGTLWITQSAAGTADKVDVCLKSAANTYSWVQIVSAP